jgi:hypothetical protein
MKWTVLALALLGCQHGGKQAASDDYKADIASLCDSMQLSGADQQQADDGRIPMQAMWLGEHIKTSEGRAFMVKIQPLRGEEHAKALDEEARRVGLASCALSAEWRK